MSCESRVGKYIPWSWGELFTCQTCGERIRQSHTVRPLPDQPQPYDYDTLYPIPEHAAAAVTA